MIEVVTFDQYFVSVYITEKTSGIHTCVAACLEALFLLEACVIWKVYVLVLGRSCTDKLIVLLLYLYMI